MLIQIAKQLEVFHGHPVIPCLMFKRSFPLLQIEEDCFNISFVWSGDANVNVGFRPLLLAFLRLVGLFSFLFHEFIIRRWFDELPA